MENIRLIISTLIHYLEGKIVLPNSNPFRNFQESICPELSKIFPLNSQQAIAGDIEFYLNGISVKLGSDIDSILTLYIF